MRTIIPKKVMVLCLILNLLFNNKNMLKPVKALIVLDLSPVIVIQIKNNRIKKRQ